MIRDYSGVRHLPVVVIEGLLGYQKEGLLSANSRPRRHQLSLARTEKVRKSIRGILASEGDSAGAGIAETTVEQHLANGVGHQPRGRINTWQVDSAIR